MRRAESRGSMSLGFLCCGPGVENNVYSSSDESESGDELDARVDVVRWPSPFQHGERPEVLPLASESPSVLPSRRRTTKDLKKLGKSEPSRRDSDGGIFSRLNVGLNGVQASLRSVIFSSNRPAARRRTIADPSIDVARQGGGRGAGRTGAFARGAAELNLAYRETRRLPDVAGEEKVAWAAGVLRIDLTETGIRTLRGLDAFPNVQTLVLDSNGLLSLPMDCPWVPSLETLWLCNNDIENLDGLLCQVSDAFPRLTTLALMGNPVWPAAKSRAREGGAPETPSPQNMSKLARVAGEGDSGTGGGRALGLETEEEKAYRLQVVRRLPGLVTLDCADITEEERARAKGIEDNRLMDVTRLLLEPEGTTDREESLSRDSPPATNRTAPASAAGPARRFEELPPLVSPDSTSLSKTAIVEGERERRSKLPDRSSLPSTWYKEPVVMDVGSGWTRMGVAGQDAPMSVFPSVVGRVDLRTYDMVLGQDKRVFVGHRAIEEANKRVAERELPTGRGPMASPITLEHPVSRGVVTNWDDMEELWRQGIEGEMGLDPMEHPILMADSTRTSPEEREKATEILFETMTTPAVHMALQPVLALYACGPSSGLIVDIGESGTQVAPIFDGFILERGMRQIDLGGKDVTCQLGALVNAKAGLMGAEDFNLKNPCDILKLEALKAKTCFVSEDIEADNSKMELSIYKPYTLPDGTKISLGRERYRAAELLFDPASASREEDSLQDTVLDAILACERKTWAVLAQTVILTGGTTELVGLNRRLQRELTRASRASGIRLKFTVMVPEDDHNNTVWVGGSMLASTGALDGLWFTRAEYEEYGAGPIHAKFAA